MTRAMLLCAGYGTRLGSLSDERPKPMLPVCDIPILRYGISVLAGHGVRDIVINLLHRGDVVKEEIGDGGKFGVRVHYVWEKDILGTGGGLKNALHLLDPDNTDEPFISMNGKLIFDVDLHGLLAAFAEAPPALGMMVVRKVPDAVDWGAVDVDTSSKTPRVRNVLGQGEYMFCGVHVTRPSVVRRLPEGEACMIRQGYLPWIQQGQAVAAFVADAGAYFAEHSTPARYLESNIALLRGAPLRFAPGTLVGVSPGAEIHASARIHEPVRIGVGARVGAGAVIGPDTVIGERATIAAGTRIERAVVWRGAEVQGEHRERIITPRTTIDAR